MDLLLDNSAISLLHCERRYQLTVVEGRRPGETKEIRTGSAFHIVQEHIDKTQDVDAAYNIARTKYPDVDMSVVVAASTLYRLTSKPGRVIDVLLNGISTPAVEVKFKYLYASFPHGHEMLNVYLCGTIDRIEIDEATDTLVIKDYKSSAAVTPGHQESIITGYDLQFQLLFYLYALIHGKILPAAYLDYITSGRYRLEYHFIFYLSKPPAFKRLVKPALPPDLLNREIPLIINSKILKAVAITQLTTPAPHDGMTTYGVCKNCPYKPGCLNMGTERELEYLQRFDVTPYNPLMFR